MAFQGGFLNVGGFMACHRFISHVTGYATYIAQEIESKNLMMALSMSIVPVCFFLGSMLSGLLVDIRLKLHKRPKYYIAFGIMCALIGVILVLGQAGYFGEFAEPLVLSRDYALLMSLSFICGVQNGTITSVSKSVIRTTHLTGITTDLGIGIIRFLHRKKLGPEIGAEGKANLMRIGIIFFFILGSLIGYSVFSVWGYLGFVVPLITSGILFGTMLYYAFILHRVFR